MISTGYFRIGKGELIRNLALHRWMTWLVIAGMVVLASTAAGIFVDIRLFIATLMLIFLLAPMMLFMLYFSDGLRFATAINTLPHRIVIDTDGIRIEAFADNTGKEDEEEAQEPRKIECRYAPGEVGRFMIYSSGLIIPVEGGLRKRGLLFLPAREAGGEESLKAAAEILGGYVTQNRG